MLLDAFLNPSLNENYVSTTECFSTKRPRADFAMCFFQGFLWEVSRIILLGVFSSLVKRILNGKWENTRITYSHTTEYHNKHSHGPPDRIPSRKSENEGS